MIHRPGFPLAVLLTMFLVLVAADSGMATAEAQFDTTLAVGIHARVHIVNVAGNITVQGVPDATEISVQGTKRALHNSPSRARRILEEIPIRYSTVGDVFNIEPGFPEDWEEPHEINYTVRIPESFRFEAVTYRGNIETSDIREVDIRDRDGNVKLTRTKIVTVETATGNVEIDTTGGPIHVTTQSGNVRAFLKEELRSIYIISQSGDVSLDMPPRPDIYLGVTTTNGEITTSGIRLENTTLTLYTMAGSAGDGELPVSIATESGKVRVITYGLSAEVPADTVAQRDRIVIRPDRSEPGDPAEKIVSMAPFSAPGKTDTLRVVQQDSAAQRRNMFIDGSMDDMVEEVFTSTPGEEPEEEIVESVMDTSGMEMTEEIEEAISDTTGMVTSEEVSADTSGVETTEEVIEVEEQPVDTSGVATPQTDDDVSDESEETDEAAESSDEEAEEPAESDDAE